MGDLYGRIIAVERKPLGGELNGNHGIGVTTLTLHDALDFEEEGGAALIQDADGNTESITYTAADDDANTITITPGLVAAWDDEDFVYVLPRVDEWRAQVLVDDASNEIIYARIPARWVDVIPEGIREVDVLEPEAVAVAFDGTEWILTDLISKTPSASAEFIDPGTFPEQPSDSTPPSVSPTPTVRGGIRQLFIQWEAITNSDPVTYQIHASETPGFTPGPSTLVTSVQGEMAIIENLNDGSVLAYEIDYYVAVIAEDKDGTAPASTVVGPTQLDPAGTLDILARAITADRIAALIILVSKIATASTGQRIEIDTDGIRCYESTGEVCFDLPTDPNRMPFISGELVAGGLEVIGPANFRSDTSFDQESFTTLEAGLSNPTTKPIVTPELEQIDAADIAGLNATTFVAGICYDTAGGAGGTTNVIWRLVHQTAVVTLQELDATTGAVLRSVVVQAANGSGLVSGVARTGDHVFALVRDSATGVTVIKKYLASDLSLVATSASLASIVLSYACLGHDAAGNLLWVTRNGAGGTQFRIYTIDPATLATTGSQNLTGGTGVGTQSIPVGIYHDSGGTDWWIARRNLGATDYIEAYDTSTLAKVANRDWRTWPQSIGDMGGMTYDSDRGVFLTVPDYNINDQKITIHTAWDWTTESALYWFGYTWYSTTGTDETLVSPLQAVDLTTYRRTRLKITHPDMPMIGDVDKHRHYVARNATEPASTALKYQAPTTYVTSETDMPSFQHDFNASGAAPPTTNSFPGATGAVAQAAAPAADQGWILRGDGLMARPHFDSSALPDPTTWTGAMVYITDFDSFAYSDGTQWVMETDHWIANQQTSAFTETGTSFALTTETQMSRIFDVDGGAKWAAGWRPQARCMGLIECSTSNIAFACVGFWDMDIGDTGSGTLLDEAAQIQESAAAGVKYLESSGWETFSASPTQAIYLFGLRTRVSGGTGTYDWMQFEIRWILT